MMQFTEIRLRSKVREEIAAEFAGKMLTDHERDVLLQGPASVRKPDGSLLCIYLPGVLRAEMDITYNLLTKIRHESDNRGQASGSQRVQVSKNHSRAKPVLSGILGSFENSGYYKHCRLTAWTAAEMNREWPELFPLLIAMGEGFAAYVPDRYEAQMREVANTHADWVIPGTPYTTITVNNTYPTGVHKDQGDLDEGFSCIAVCRRGNFTGGVLTFPEYRVGVDMQDGDLLLMDAHSFHGNTLLFCECGKRLELGPCGTCGAERISVVAYFRTNITECGTRAEETLKAQALADRGLLREAA